MPRIEVDNREQPRWHAAATQPRRELWAIEHLSRQGYVTFMPKRRIVTRHARRRVERIGSFFPGYVFIRFDPRRQQWRSINGTYGVRSLVMQGETPCRAPAGLVETLQAMTDDDGYFVPNPSFERGDRVRLISGPFRELIAEVDDATDERRITVLLDMMNGRVPVLVNRSELSRAV